MRRARNSEEWQKFFDQATKQGFEIITRIGDPVLLHKEGTPFTVETVWFVFFKRPGGWTKKQRLGMKIYRDLGLKVFPYPGT